MRKEKRIHAIFSKSISEIQESEIKEYLKLVRTSHAQKAEPHIFLLVKAQKINRKCLNKCCLVKLMFDELHIVGGCKRIIHVAAA